MKAKIVRRRGGAHVIEWYDVDADEGPQYYRSILPASEVPGSVGDAVEVDAPEMGIPYGERWDELLVEGGVSALTAQRISNELRRLGIWTILDLEQNVNEARAAFQRGYGMDVQRLRQAAKARLA